MSGDRTRLLLALLAAAVLVSAVAVAAYLGAERLAAARSRSALYEAQIRKLAQTLPAEETLLSRRDLLRGELERLEAGYYRAGEMNPYSFGTLIKEKLAELGMDIARYQVVEAGGRSSLEFVASGSPLAVALFLREAFGSGRYWSVPSLTIKRREGTERVDVVLSVSYEILDRKDR